MYMYMYMVNHSYSVNIFAVCQSGKDAAVSAVYSQTPKAQTTSTNKAYNVHVRVLVYQRVSEWDR